MKRFYSYDKGLIAGILLVILIVQIDFPETIDYVDYRQEYVDSMLARDSLYSMLTDVPEDSLEEITSFNDSTYLVRNILISEDSVLQETIHGGYEGCLTIRNIDSADVNFATTYAGGPFEMRYVNNSNPSYGGSWSSIEWCDFSYGIDVSSCRFRDITLVQSAFGPVKMYEVECRDEAYFEMNDFRGPLIIDHSRFNDVTFENTYFNEVQINSSHITGTLRFQNCVFTGPLSFNGSDSINAIEFVDCTLPQIISFRGEQEQYFREQNVVNRISFEGYNSPDSSNQVCYLDFPVTFSSKLSGMGIDYMKYRLWFPEETSYENRSLFYLTLLKHFEDVGYTESYEALDKEYQKLQYLHNGLGLVDTFNRVWWDYGYNKLKVIFNSLLLCAIFCLINIFLFERLNKKVYPVKFTPLVVPSREEIRRSPWYKKIALWIESALNHFGNSVIYTSALFFGLKLELDRFKSNSSLKLYVLLMYCLGLFCVAYIVNIIIVR